jgi:hypothetical protein
MRPRSPADVLDRYRTPREDAAGSAGALHTTNLPRDMDAIKSSAVGRALDRRFKAGGRTVRFLLGAYPNGRLAIDIVDPRTTESWTMLTHNVPTANVSDGEILVRDYSEAEPYARAALATGCFEDTGRRAGPLAVWRVRAPAQPAARPRRGR